MSTVGNYTSLNLAKKKNVETTFSVQEDLQKIYSKTQRNQGHVVTGQEVTTLN